MHAVEYLAMKDDCHVCSVWLDTLVYNNVCMIEDDDGRVTVIAAWSPLVTHGNHTSNVDHLGSDIHSPLMRNERNDAERRFLFFELLLNLIGQFGNLPSRRFFTSILSGPATTQETQLSGAIRRCCNMHNIFEYGHTHRRFYHTPTNKYTQSNPIRGVPHQERFGAHVAGHHAQVLR